MKKLIFLSLCLILSGMMLMMFACAKTEDFQTSEIETSIQKIHFPARKNILFLLVLVNEYGGVKSFGKDENMNGVDDDEVIIQYMFVTEYLYSRR